MNWRLFRPLLLVPLALVFVLLTATACQSDTGIKTTPIPTTSVSTVTGEEAADDIMLTPGGPGYRAGLHQQGVVNPWSPIESSEVTLGDNDNVIYLTYRDYIETRAGESRNNILNLRTPGGDISSLNLYTGYIPSGIEVKERMRWHGPPGRFDAVLIIEVSQDVKPGEYTFGISLEIDGKDYGWIPCTIKVVNKN